MCRKFLKVGVVGVGGIAKAHMPGWAASEQAEVVAGSDISTEALERWGALYGVKELANDPAEVVQRSGHRHYRCLHAEPVPCANCNSGAGSGQTRTMRKAAGADTGGNSPDDSGPRSFRQAADDGTALPLQRRFSGA